MKRESKDTERRLRALQRALSEKSPVIPPDHSIAMDDVRIVVLLVSRGIFQVETGVPSIDAMDRDGAIAKLVSFGREFQISGDDLLRTISREMNMKPDWIEQTLKEATMLRALDTKGKPN